MSKPNYAVAALKKKVVRLESENASLRVFVSELADTSKWRRNEKHEVVFNGEPTVLISGMARRLLLKITGVE